VEWLQWQWVAGLATALIGWLGRRQLRAGSWLQRRMAVEKSLAIAKQTIADMEVRDKRKDVEIDRLVTAIDRLAHAGNLVRTAMETDDPSLIEMSVRKFGKESPEHTSLPTS
jgi:hypothetical protein